MMDNQKNIYMFVMSNIFYLQNAGYRLALIVQAFFMPGHKYLIWYPCTPVWNCNGTTAFCRCVRQRERHGYFIFNNISLCLTNKIYSSLLLQTETWKRSPTKRVFPYPAILMPTWMLTASNFTSLLLVTTAVKTRMAMLLRVVLMFVAVGIAWVRRTTNHLFIYSWNNIRNTVDIYVREYETSITPLLFNYKLIASLNPIVRAPYKDARTGKTMPS